MKHIEYKFTIICKFNYRKNNKVDINCDFGNIDI